MKNICYLKEDFETRLAAVANIRVYDTETLAKSLCKPSLFDAALFEHLFYAVHGFIHFVIIKSKYCAAKI